MLLRDADVNGDGNVNSVDFGWMISKLLGKIDKISHIDLRPVLLILF